METSCHELADGGRLLPLPVDEAVSRWKRNQGAFWIDIEGYDRATLETLLGQLGVTDFLKRRCLRAGETTIVVATPQGTFADVVVFADRACTRRARVAVLALKNLLVTMKAEPVEEAVPIREAIEGLELRELSTSKVLYALLLEHATVTGRVARGLREKLLATTDRMDHYIENVDTEELESVVRAVLLTLSVADEQRETFALLSGADSDGFVTSEMEARLSLLNTTAAATERLIRRLDDRTEGLLRRKQDHKQELLNRRLGLLTIISAIFLPLTLMAGIWGMNFENMPELDQPYAYWSALGLMGLVGVGSAWLFYKRGWFD